MLSLSSFCFLNPVLHVSLDCPFGFLSPLSWNTICTTFYCLRIFSSRGDHGNHSTTEVVWFIQCKRHQVFPTHSQHQPVYSNVCIFILKLWTWSVIENSKVSLDCSFGFLWPLSWNTICTTFYCLRIFTTWYKLYLYYGQAWKLTGYSMCLIWFIIVPSPCQLILAVLLYNTCFPENSKFYFVLVRRVVRIHHL
jgi:hypothetical protein